MLDPNSWAHFAKGLTVGERLRENHDCGPGFTLTVNRTEAGTHAWCFRCNDKGWLPAPPEPLAVRLARLAKSQEVDDAIGGAVALPSPAVLAWAEWPAQCRLWLLKAGLCAADLPGLGAYYHPPSGRVVLPILGPSGGTVFWQARAVDGRQPKYLAPPVDKHTVLAAYGKATAITLTEDILSAYKVGLVGEGWSMLGTSLNNNTLAHIVARGCSVNVWLDPDGPGKKAATKVLAKLRAAGVPCRNITSKADPKLVHLEQMKELLCRV